MRRSLAPLMPVLAALISAACGCGVGGYEVVRVQAGRATVGRFVSPEAYAASLEAAIAEERGDWPRAVELLRRAREEDPDGVELGARLGVALCHVGKQQAGLFAIDDALRVDPDLERGWTARARCALLVAKTDAQRGQARADLERALGCDPEALEPTLLLADLDVRAGALPRARLRVEEALILHPRSARVRRVLAEIAARQGDAARAVWAALGAAALDEPTGAMAKATVREAAERSGVSSYALALRGVPAPRDREAPGASCAPVVDALQRIATRGDAAEISIAAAAARAQCPELEGEITGIEVVATWSPEDAAQVEARALAAPLAAVRRFGARMRLRGLPLSALLEPMALPPAEDRETLALHLAASAARSQGPEERALAATALDLAPSEPTVARLCAEAERRHDARPGAAHARACALARTKIEKLGCRSGSADPAGL